MSIPSTKFIGFPIGDNLTHRMSVWNNQIMFDGNKLPEELVWEIALGERDNPQTIPTGVLLVTTIPPTVGTIFWIPRQVQEDTDLISYMEGEYTEMSYFCVQNSMFIGAAKSIILKPLV